MAIDFKQFELDRVVNLMKAFGWTITQSRFEGDKVIVELEKIVKPEVPKP